jgi:hypothetical protein
MATAAAPTLRMPTMVGGAKFQQEVLDWTKQSSHLYTTVTCALIFIWAVYAEKIPAAWRWQLSTTIGRTLLLLLLYIVYMLAGWIPALLFAIAIAMTWANRPLQKPAGVKEGFNNRIVTDVDGKNMWFAEKVIGRDPHTIIQDRVDTDAVQSNSQKGNPRTSK